MLAIFGKQAVVEYFMLLIHKPLCAQQFGYWCLGAVLKHQVISIHSPDYMFIALDQFHTKILVIENNIKK